MGALLSQSDLGLLSQLSAGMEQQVRSSAIAVRAAVAPASGERAPGKPSIQQLAPPATIIGKTAKMPACDKFTGTVPPGCTVDPNWCNKVGSPFNCEKKEGGMMQPPPRSGMPGTGAPGEKNKMLPYLLLGGGLVALYLFTKK